MINAKKLEKKWYKYKTKGLLLVSSILGILGLLIYGGYYVLYKMEFNLKPMPSESPKITPAPKVINESNNTFSQKEEGEIVEVKSKESQLLLKPTIPVVDLENEKLKDREAKKQVLIKRKNIAKRKEARKKRLVKAKPSSYLTSDELAVIQGKNIHTKRVAKKINFNKSTNNYMEIMKVKFAKNKNPREALLIAKAYYRAGDYENSEKWSLKANSLDRKLDDSWLLFAKSQDKLGKRKEALEVLLAYYNRSKSVKIKNLIDKMRQKSI